MMTEYRPPIEHAPRCKAPRMEWDPAWPGLARVARCVNCGCVEIDRTGQTIEIPIASSASARRWDK